MATIGSINRFFLDSPDRTLDKGSIHAMLKQFQNQLKGFLVRLSYGFALTASVTVVCVMMLVSFPDQSLAENTVMPTATSTEGTATVDESVDIAAEKIGQFSQAYLQVLELLSDREAEIPAAETNAEALKIEQSIEADAIAIIQANGLTMPEYMQILGLASQDATFQDKVLESMDETQEES